METAPLLPPAYRNPRDISKDIRNFPGVFQNACFFLYFTKSRGTPNHVQWNHGWEMLSHDIGARLGPAELLENVVYI